MQTQYYQTVKETDIKDEQIQSIKQLLKQTRTA